MTPSNPETNVLTLVLSPGSRVQLLSHFNVPGWWHVQAEWMPWIWRRTRRRSRGMKLFDDVGNIIGLALGKRRDAMRPWKEREEQK